MSLATPQSTASAVPSMLGRSALVTDANKTPLTTQATHDEEFATPWAPCPQTSGVQSKGNGQKSN